MSPPARSTSSFQASAIVAVSKVATTDLTRDVVVAERLVISDEQRARARALLESAGVKL
jgi:hypothetical protein